MIDNQLNKWKNVQVSCSEQISIYGNGQGVTRELLVGAYFAVTENVITVNTNETRDTKAEAKAIVSENVTNFSSTLHSHMFGGTFCYQTWCAGDQLIVNDLEKVLNLNELRI